MLEAIRTSAGDRQHADRRLRFLSTLFVVAALVAACSPSGHFSQPLPLPVTTASHGTRSATTTTNMTTLAAVVPPGFTGFTSSEHRFAIAVPSDWTHFDPTSPGADKVIQNLQATNPAAPKVSAADLAGYGMRFVAGDGTPKNDVNVIVRPSRGAVDDLWRMATRIKADFVGFGATVRSSELVQLSGREAFRIAVDVSLVQPDGRRSVSQVQYFVVANDVVYTLTLAGESPHLPTIATTFVVG